VVLNYYITEVKWFINVLCHHVFFNTGSPPNHQDSL